MSLPRKTENSARYARLATRNVLTRLALLFQSSADKTFTGAEVVEILLTTVAAVGTPEDRAELLTAADPGADEVQS